MSIKKSGGKSKTQVLLPGHSIVRRKYPGRKYKNGSSTIKVKRTKAKSLANSFVLKDETQKQRFFASNRCLIFPLQKTLHLHY